MVEVKTGRVPDGIVDDFFGIDATGNGASMASVLEAADRLSNLIADGLELRFGGAAYCKEVVSRARGLINSVYSMGNELYMVPAVSRKLEEYDVTLTMCDRIKLAARFYARPMIALWAFSYLVSAAATAFLVVRFAITAYGVAAFGVPAAALGYLSAVIAGVCMPLASCIYMMKQIGFAFEKFLESIKIARICAYENPGVEVSTAGLIAPSYYEHSVSDYDFKHSQRLVKVSSALLALVAISLYGAFLLDVIPRSSFILGSEVTFAGLRGGLLVWADAMVVVLAIVVGVLLTMSKTPSNTAKFLHDEVVACDLERAIIEYASSAGIRYRGEAFGQEQAATRGVFTRVPDEKQDVAAEQLIVPSKASVLGEKFAEQTGYIAHDASAPESISKSWQTPHERIESLMRPAVEDCSRPSSPAPVVACGFRDIEDFIEQVSDCRDCERACLS